MGSIFLERWVTGETFNFLGNPEFETTNVPIVFVLSKKNKAQIAIDDDLDIVCKDVEKIQYAGDISTREAKNIKILEIRSGVIMVTVSDAALIVWVKENNKGYTLKTMLTRRDVDEHCFQIYACEYMAQEGFDMWKVILC